MEWRDYSVVGPFETAIHAAEGSVETLLQLAAEPRDASAVVFPSAALAAVAGGPAFDISYVHRCPAVPHSTSSQALVEHASGNGLVSHPLLCEEEEVLRLQQIDEPFAGNPGNDREEQLAVIAGLRQMLLLTPAASSTTLVFGSAAVGRAASRQVASVVSLAVDNLAALHSSDAAAPAVIAIPSPSVVYDESPPTPVFGPGSPASVDARAGRSAIDMVSTGAGSSTLSAGIRSPSIRNNDNNSSCSRGTPIPVLSAVHEQARGAAVGVGRIHITAAAGNTLQGTLRLKIDTFRPGQGPPALRRAAVMLTSMRAQVQARVTRDGIPACNSTRSLGRYSWLLPAQFPPVPLLPLPHPCAHPPHAASGAIVPLPLLTPWLAPTASPLQVFAFYCVKTCIRSACMFQDATGSTLHPSLAPFTLQTRGASDAHCQTEVRACLPVSAISTRFVAVSDGTTGKILSRPSDGCLSVSDVYPGQADDAASLRVFWLRGNCINRSGIIASVAASARDTSDAFQPPSTAAATHHDDASGQGGVGLETPWRACVETCQKYGFTSLPQLASSAVPHLPLALLLEAAYGSIQALAAPSGCATFIGSTTEPAWGADREMGSDGSAQTVLNRVNDTASGGGGSMPARGLSVVDSSPSVSTSTIGTTRIAPPLWSSTVTTSRDLHESSLPHSTASPSGNDGKGREAAGTDTENSASVAVNASSTGNGNTTTNTVSERATGGESSSTPRHIMVSTRVPLADVMKTGSSARQQGPVDAPPSPRDTNALLALLVNIAEQLPAGREGCSFVGAGRTVSSGGSSGSMACGNVQSALEAVLTVLQREAVLAAQLNFFIAAISNEAIELCSIDTTPFHIHHTYLLEPVALMGRIVEHVESVLYHGLGSLGTVQLLCRHADAAFRTRGDVLLQRETRVSIVSIHAFRSIMTVLAHHAWQCAVQQLRAGWDIGSCSGADHSEPLREPDKPASSTASVNIHAVDWGAPLLIQHLQMLQLCLHRTSELACASTQHSTSDTGTGTGSGIGRSGRSSRRQSVTDDASGSDSEGDFTDAVSISSISPEVEEDSADTEIPSHLQSHPPIAAPGQATDAISSASRQVSPPMYLLEPLLTAKSVRPVSDATARVIGAAATSSHECFSVPELHKIHAPASLVALPPATTDQTEAQLAAMARLGLGFSTLQVPEYVQGLRDGRSILRPECGGISSRQILSPAVIRADMESFRSVNHRAGVLDFLRWYIPDQWHACTNEGGCCGAMRGKDGFMTMKRIHGLACGSFSQLAGGSVIRVSGGSSVSDEAPNAADTTAGVGSISSSGSCRLHVYYSNPPHGPAFEYWHSLWTSIRVGRHARGKPSQLFNPMLAAELSLGYLESVTGPELLLQLVEVAGRSTATLVHSALAYATFALRRASNDMSAGHVLSSLSTSLHKLEHQCLNSKGCVDALRHSLTMTTISSSSRHGSRDGIQSGTPRTRAGSTASDVTAGVGPSSTTVQVGLGAIDDSSVTAATVEGKRELLSGATADPYSDDADAPSASDSILKDTDPRDGRTGIRRRKHHDSAATRSQAVVHVSDRCTTAFEGAETSANSPSRRNDVTQTSRNGMNELPSPDPRSESRTAALSIAEGCISELCTAFLPAVADCFTAAHRTSSLSLLLQAACDSQSIGEPCPEALVLALALTDAPPGEIVPWHAGWHVTTFFAPPTQSTAPSRKLSHATSQATANPSTTSTTGSHPANAGSHVRIGIDQPVDVVYPGRSTHTAAPQGATAGGASSFASGDESLWSRLNQFVQTQYRPLVLNPSYRRISSISRNHDAGELVGPSHNHDLPFTALAVLASHTHMANAKAALSEGLAHLQQDETPQRDGQQDNITHMQCRVAGAECLQRCQPDDISSHHSSVNRGFGHAGANMIDSPATFAPGSSSLAASVVTTCKHRGARAALAALLCALGHAPAWHYLPPPLPPAMSDAARMPSRHDRATIDAALSSSGSGSDVASVMAHAGGVLPTPDSRLWVSSACQPGSSFPLFRGAVLVSSDGSVTVAEASPEL